MFLGYQNNLLALAADTLENLVSNAMTFDRIEETDQPVEMIDHVYVIGSDAIQNAKRKHVREKRNIFLVKYVDPIVSNPLRWADMSIEEQNNIKAYRQYLLDIPDVADYPNAEILPYDTWLSNYKQSQSLYV